MIVRFNYDLKRSINDGVLGCAARRRTCGRWVASSTKCAPLSDHSKPRIRSKTPLFFPMQFSSFRHVPSHLANLLHIEAIFDATFDSTVHAFSFLTPNLCGQAALMLKILRGKYDDQIISERLYSPELTEIVQACLTMDPAFR